jgi:hypothetical protein
VSAPLAWRVGTAQRRRYAPSVAPLPTLRTTGETEYGGRTTEDG